MPRGVVLNFHRELDGTRFEKGVLALKKRYRMIGLPELYQLLAEGKSVNNTCHLSFDDGEISFYEVVFPLLKKQQVPASLFVSPKIIQEEINFWFQEVESFNDYDFRKFLANQLDLSVESFTGLTTFSILKCFRIAEIQEFIRTYQSLKGLKNAPRFNMNVGQLIEVDQSGLVTVGAHTQDHPILKNETDEDSAYQIKESVRHLEQMIGHPVKYFAYPNGKEGYDFTDREINYLKEAGIELAFSTITDHLVNMTSMFKLPRVYYATTLGLKPSHPYVMWRLALGNKWPRFRKRPEERDMRDQFSRILEKNNIG